MTSVARCSNTTVQRGETGATQRPAKRRRVGIRSQETGLQGAVRQAHRQQRRPYGGGQDDRGSGPAIARPARDLGRWPVVARHTGQRGPGDQTLIQEPPDHQPPPQGCAVRHSDLGGALAIQIAETRDGHPARGKRGRDQPAGAMDRPPCAVRQVAFDHHGPRTGRHRSPRPGAPCCPRTRGCGAGGSRVSSPRSEPAAARRDRLRPGPLADVRNAPSVRSAWRGRYPAPARGRGPAPARPPATRRRRWTAPAAGAP